MPEQIHEATTALQAKTVEGKPGRLRIGIISPGQGSSGFYSQEVLEAAAADKVWPAGTHMYFNHPTAAEKFDQPERDVLKIGAVLDEDAYWDADLGTLVAEATPIETYRPLLTDPTFRKAVGVSIVASAEVEETTTGRVVTKLVEGKSIDFVTHAGRGGSILDVLESALPANVNGRAIANGVTEATVNDQREALDDVLKNAHGADGVYVWLRDFDATTAWFEISTDGTETTYSQAYSTGDNGLALAMTGDRTEVRQVTQYVPVTPVGQSTTQESSGGHMATTTIEESALSELREAAGRVTALVSERDTAIEERDAARAENITLREAANDGRMAAIITEAGADFTPLEVAGLKSKAKVVEGKLDEAAFKTTVDEAAAAIAEANGAGRPRGNGRRPAPTQDEVSEADLDALEDGVYGPVKEA